MQELYDIQGNPIKSGFYRDPRQDSVHYFDLENLKIIRADNSQIEMSASFCRYFTPLKNPEKFAENYIQVANFIISKLESLSQTNKANLSAKGAEAKMVSIKNYKTKEQKEAEERFFHLSDHLFPEKGPENPDNSA